MIDRLQLTGISLPSQVLQLKVLESNIATDHSKEIIDSKDKFRFYNLLAMVDNELTGKQLDVYYKRANTKERFIASHENIMGVIDHFLDNANAINPYAKFALFLSDGESKVIFNIDSKRAGGKVHKLIDIELKTNNEGIRERFEKLKNDNAPWDKLAQTNVSKPFAEILVKHLEHMPGVEIVTKSDGVYLRDV